MNVLSITAVLEKALELEASDVLITSGEPVIYKVHGSWVRHFEWGVLDDEAVRILLQDLLQKEVADEFFREGNRRDLDFSTSLPSGERFRVNMYRVLGRYSAVLRTIPKEPKRLEELGLPMAPIEAALRKRKGMILVTGATGSGKSTTLAAMLEWLNERFDLHIVTIEDPIEFYFTPKRCVFSQREVGKDVESFSMALRSALRQAPDVIMVGEMRDLETIQAAITAAETGHLVMATLHTRSAAESVSRIIDAFPEGYREMVRLQLSSSLNLVVSQVLIPRADGKGRVLASEVLVNTPAVSTLIREGKIQQIPAVMSTSVASHGMQTMEMSIESLVQRGLIKRESAVGVLPEGRPFSDERFPSR